MCWCSQDYSGLVQGHTRCEGHVGEVLCHHLPEPRGRRSQKPLSLTGGLTPPPLQCLVSPLSCLTTPPGNGDSNSWETASSHLGTAVVMVRKVAATRAWAGVGDAAARRRHRVGVGAASARWCPASVAVTGSEKNRCTLIGAPEGMGAGNS